MRVAFQGEWGAYSDAAAHAYFGPPVETVPCANFDAVFDAVTGGTVDAGLVPIENSAAGSIHRNYDLLQRHDLHIVGETVLRVRHCLLARPGVTLDEVRVVRSHPQALAQCEHYLAGLGVTVEAAYDTAGSARDLAASGDRTAAAIASAYAAEVYGLTILAEGIEDLASNATRFLALSRTPSEPAGAAKTSLVCTLSHQPGSLFRALGAFALRDVDLLKIESRPVPERSWEYLFYLDVAGALSDTPVARAIEHLREMTPYCRVLGSYPRTVWPAFVTTADHSP